MNKQKTITREEVLGFLSFEFPSENIRKFTDEVLIMLCIMNRRIINGRIAFRAL